MARRSRTMAWLLVCTFLAVACGGSTGPLGNAADGSPDAETPKGEAAETPPTLPPFDLSCWSHGEPAECDPRSADACGSDRRCLFTISPTRISVACETSRSNADLGEPCDANSACNPTLLCAEWSRRC